MRYKNLSQERITKDSCYLLDKDPLEFLNYVGVNVFKNTIPIRSSNWDIDGTINNLKVHIKVTGLEIEIYLDYIKEVVHVYDFSIERNNQRKGLGARIFKSIIDYCQADGFEKVTCTAGNNFEDLHWRNSYITAIKFGFLMDHNAHIRYCDMLKRFKLPYTDPYNFIMTKEGEDLWKYKGFPYYCEYHLNPDSQSHINFENYLVRRGILTENQF